jgi:hypothetical protein
MGSAVTKSAHDRDIEIRFASSPGWEPRSTPRFETARSEP